MNGSNKLAGAVKCAIIEPSSRSFGAMAVPDRIPPENRKMELTNFKPIMKQYTDGLISWSEFLLAVQLEPEQIELLEILHKLPLKAYWKIEPEDL